ncbi:MAG TPA: ATP-binding cassette domain-containing protein [Bryobacteraceae bacterium]|jgi:phospholipid/cholesterol/gamma-HCH transport system ATP-binding protein|nr:ATP-binding cassette domain-containing protein [Bryobacteraceae bacterium]
MPDTPGPIVDFEQVSVRFEETWALRNVSFKLNAGETHIILGAAGSGKTTLLKAAIGLVGVDDGDIKLFGQEITSLTEHDLYPLRSRIGVLFQEGGLFDSLSVGDNVEYPLLNRQNPNGQNLDGQSGSEPSSVETQAREALRFVELEQTFDKFPSEVSGGMRRRVGIARAIVTEPQLVLYDSPTAGLDPITANTIMALILKERDVRNTASLIVTHRYQDGELMADFRYDPQQQELLHLPKEDGARHRTRFIVMKEGEIVFFGTREELASSTDEYVKRFFKHEE